MKGYTSGNIRNIALLGHGGTGKTTFLEAALLLEEGYDRLCDEIWYVFADEETRRKRLSERGYSTEKIDGIIDLQLKKEDFQDILL